MSDSVSGRPITSAPPISTNGLNPDSANDENSEGNSESAANNHKLWVPHLLDFIVLAGQAEKSTTLSIPPLFLQPHAVDTSMIIGNGATFTAAIRALPPGQPQVEDIADGIHQTITMGARPRPGYVVYKTARVAFLSKGEPVQNHRSTMASAMMELYTLIHPPLLKHPNIVDFLGLAWGGNPFEPAHRLPVIVVEYAEHGTLADLQDRQPLTSKLRKSLCLDIALGLDILHRCGIVHGDVKSENVLIFSHPERQFIAKVADFGYSLVEATVDDLVNLGGTRPWKAPETKSRVPKDQLRLTDVYSFGLLVWRLALDGMSPFDFIIAEQVQADQRQVEVDRLKREDEMVKTSKLENWYFAYFVASKAYRSSTVPKSNIEILELLQYYVASSERLQSCSDEVFHLIGHICTTEACSIDLKNTFNTLLRRKMLADPFYGILDHVLEKCLGKIPESRDFQGAIKLLQNEGSRSSIDSEAGNIKLNIGYTQHNLPWLRLQALDPSIQTLIFNAFEANRKEGRAEGTLNPPQYFTLVACYINGYGTEPNDDEAGFLILTASKYHSISAAHYYRICSALNMRIEPIQPTIDVLATKSLEGARMSLQDLEILAPEKVKSIKETLRNFLAGVGADFFHAKNMLYGGSIRDWRAVLSEKSLRAKRLDPIRDSRDIHAFPINQRGDSILHMAASCGLLDAVEDLIDNYSMRVNHLNEQGETALLCACRAGQAITVQSLLERRADASIATRSNESPLHWLLSFTGSDVEIIGDMLLASGANAHLVTTKSISYSVFPSGIGVDHQEPGTPLAWAVRHNRSDIVKYLLDRTDPTTIVSCGSEDKNALHYAAFFHHYQCAELMLDALESHKINFTYGPYIDSARMGSDRFSMMIRHGSKYKAAFQATMDLFQTRTKPAVFATGLGSFGCTLLYTAVESSHDMLVEYLLPIKPSQETNEQSVANIVPAISRLGLSESAEDGRGIFSPKDINKACGPDKRTPLLESVRRNRKAIFQLLIQNGANALATSKNPFVNSRLDWTALHTFAYAGHNSDVSLISDLVAAGIPIDGRPFGDLTTETPLTVAIHNNAFHLASKFLEIGADINAVSRNSGFTLVEHPMTILGHIIVSNSRYTTPRLKYLLFECAKADDISFIVEPHRHLTALHRAAWRDRDVGTAAASEVHIPDEDDPLIPPGHKIITFHNTTGETRTIEFIRNHDSTPGFSPALVNLISPPAREAPPPNPDTTTTTTKTTQPQPRPPQQPHPNPTHPEPIPTHPATPKNPPPPSPNNPHPNPPLPLQPSHQTDPIIYELLQRFHHPSHLNARCSLLGRTALHLAVEAGNVAAVDRLLERGADGTMVDEAGETPGGLARRLLLRRRRRRDRGDGGGGGGGDCGGGDGDEDGGGKIEGGGRRELEVIVGLLGGEGG